MTARMRLVEVIRLIAPSLGIIAAIVLGTRRQMFRRLLQAGATGPATAQPIKGTGLSGFWRRKLLAASVLRPADGDRYWLEVETWRAYQRRRKRRALIVVAIVGTLAAATVAYVAWRGRTAKATAPRPLVSSPAPGAANARQVLRYVHAVFADARLVESLEVPQLGTGQFRLGRVLSVASELIPGGYLVVELTSDDGLPLAGLALTEGGDLVMAEDRRGGAMTALDLSVVAASTRARLGRDPRSSRYVYFHNPLEGGVSFCRPLVEAHTDEGTLYFTSRSEVFANQASAVARRLAPDAPVRYEMQNGIRFVSLGRW